MKSFLQALKSYSVKTVLSKGLSITMSTHVIISYQKTGKTWVRMMLGKILSESYGVKQELDLEKMTLWKKGAPKILISHAGSTTKEPKIDFLKLFRKKKIIVLARDPRDMVVSLYHSAKNREKTYAGDLSAYIRDEDYGIMRIITFMNKWMEEVQRRGGTALLVRYEDLKEDTFTELKRMVDFLGIPATSEMIKTAVEQGSFENMRTMEATGVFDDRRMKPIDASNVDSFKTRKGKVGSYKEEMSAEDIVYVDEMVKGLDKDLGY